MELINPLAFQAALKVFVLFLIVCAMVVLLVLGIDKVGEKRPVLGGTLIVLLTTALMITILYVFFLVIYNPSILW